MNLLQYKSNEMVSSTELIRKSKNIFNKLQNKDIEKAVILRDGKPSFMLMDFKKYEELINEYLELKEKAKTKTKVIKEEIQELPSLPKVKEEVFDEINNDDLEDALAQIEQMDLELQKEPVLQKDEQLKDFWE